MKILPLDKDKEVALGNNAYTTPVRLGDEVTRDANHSQFGGRVTYSVTRIDGQGNVYGKWRRGEFYELEPEDCM